MAEIAWMAAVERLDMLLNDAMYGILFRDINMCRTFVDQYVSRRIIARSGIIINTGEDNYLTTADAVEKAHTVLAIQFINEAFAKRAGPARRADGARPRVRDQPVARGQLPPRARAGAARAADLRRATRSSGCRRPSSRRATSSRATSHDAMFNLVGVTTNQSIELLGMFSEAIHTPLLMDRYLSLKARAYVFNAARAPRRRDPVEAGGIVEKRAREVLDEAHELLDEVQARDDLGRDRPRRLRRREAHAHRRQGLRGRRRERATDYVNPILDALERRGVRRMHSAHMRPRKPLRAYGDREGDGMVQMSFVLRSAAVGRAREAAKRFAEAHGLREPLVTTMEQCARRATRTSSCTATRSTRSTSPTIEVPRCGTEPLSREEIEHRVEDAARPQDRRRRRVHRLATRTPSASTRSSTTRATPATRASRATRLRGVQPRRAGRERAAR